MNNSARLTPSYFNWFSKLTFTLRAKVPLVTQAEASECGISCLCMISAYFGNHVHLRDMRKLMPASQQGLSMHQLVEYAQILGLSSRPVKLEQEELIHLQLPAILHWNFAHFVVLTKVSRKYLYISDPALGERKIAWSLANKSFTGIALELSPNHDFTPTTKNKSLSLWDFAKPIKGVKQQLGLLVGLSILMQTFALAAPFYMQTVVDKVLQSASQPLLLVLAMGFTLLLVIESFTKWLREVVLLRFSHAFNLHISSSVLAHLMRLPMSYFQRRHMGDIVSRFGSLQAVRDTLTQGLVTALIDGLLSIITLIVLFVYSWQLACIVIAVVILYGLGRWALFYPVKHLNQQILHSDAKQQSYFMQSIRAARTIKLANTNNLTQTKWMDLFVDNVNKQIRLGQWNIGFSLANKVLFGLENIAVVYIGATLVMANEFSTGMLFAFMNYKMRFTESTASLLDKWIDYKILNVHLTRIEDIVHHAPETPNNLNEQLDLAGQHQVTSIRTSQTLGARINICHISFRYHSNQPWLFENLSLKIEAGDYIAIIGASGSGKTSLLHCLLGLSETTKGTITFNHALFSPATRSHQRISAVMQDDQLLSGSVIDNISQFAEQVDIKRVLEVSKLACIDTDIMAMTMQYQTLIGDMGDSLSGGQKQRILLARALYQKPDLLVLDEATSHLDIATEAQVCSHLKNLPTTIIMVAHRPHTIATANKVFSLSPAGLTLVNYAISELPKNEITSTALTSKTTPHQTKNKLKEDHDDK